MNDRQKAIRCSRCSATGTSTELLGDKGTTYNIRYRLSIGWARVVIEDNMGDTRLTLCPECRGPLRQLQRLS